MDNKNNANLNELSDNANLNALSDNKLLMQIKNLVTRERETLVDILKHLQEINSRRLHLELGFSSLWEYVTKELGYSEGAAQRRIEAMRAISDLPILEQKIEAGRLSISNIAKAQSVMRKINQGRVAGQPTISDETKIEIFRQLEDKSQKEADIILAERFPEVVKSKESIRALNANEFEVRLVISKKLKEKLEKVKNLLSHKIENPNTSELLEAMTDFVISKKDITVGVASKTDSDSTNLGSNTTNPDLGVSNAESSILKAGSGTPKIVSIAPNTEKTNPRGAKESPPQRRYVPMSTRRAVWQKAKGECEFVNLRSGRKCNGRHKLEIEHVRPIAFGGSHQPENLRLYCRAHNQFTARQATLS